MLEVTKVPIFCVTVTSTTQGWSISTSTPPPSRASTPRPPPLPFLPCRKKCLLLVCQVFWKGLPPVSLPADVVQRFDGKAMMVVGFEVDQAPPLSYT